MVKLTAVTSRTSTPKFGMFKGRIRISDDFDAPLESFSEYLPPAGRKRKR